MKKPLLYALVAALYIVIIVFVLNSLTSILRGDTMLIPMLILSLFVLSAAIMGFLFLSEPIHLYIENRKQEAITFFAKIVGIFACFVVIFLILGLIWGGNKAGTIDINTNLQVYQNTAKGFSISYLPGYLVDESYTYQELGPGQDIAGVKFTIPATLSSGTNLSADSYLSVELLPGAINSCSAERFLDNPTSAGFVDVNDHRYSIATADGAGAGNRYKETIYATPIMNGCLAVRYFIHYSVFENYPAGTIGQFDQQALLNQFNKIRQTLVINL